MTVAELIRKLSEFPGDMRVVTPGFDESGYSDVDRVEEIGIDLNVRSSGHCGEHDDGNQIRAVLVNW